jgi:hypothetical protein
MNNPIAVELLLETESLSAIGVDNPEELMARFDNIGGWDAIKTAAEWLMMADLQMYPQTLMVRPPESIYNAIVSGFFLGIAAIERQRKIASDMPEI